jgi:hypothetical protein
MSRLALEAKSLELPRVFLRKLTHRATPCSVSVPSEVHVVADELSRHHSVLERT